MAGQEREAEEPGAHAGAGRDQEAEAHPAHRQDAQPVLDVADVGAEVLQQESDGERDAGGEAAARKVVAAQEEVGRQHDDRREHPAHDHRRHRHVVAERVAEAAIIMFVVERVLDLLLLGQADGFLRRAEAAQQREDRQRDDAEHGDLAEGVEAAEVDEDDVHHVGAAALGVGVLEEPGGDAAVERHDHHRVGDAGDAEAAGGGDDEVAAAAGVRGGGPVTGDLLAPFRQPAQAEQQQHGRDDLDENLGDREVGRRQPDEADAGDETGAADQHQRHEAVVPGLPRPP